ncbi:MAG TPA: hypothetical protein VFQ54_00340, partial [Thermomicrobiales bacterium]|nr:hypothetical protein [Thermomicrobiales bacterium]
FTVATEPVRKTPESEELATQAREIIVAELRRQYLLPPDAALGRAFAAANGYIYEKTHENLPPDAEIPIQIGATAVVFDGHVATFGHVPPGQLILVEDGLVYALPELESWLPHYADRQDDGPPVEPLGYGPRIAPIIAQTDLRSGDTILLCSTGFGQAFAEEMADAAKTTSDLGFLHGRDPDRILDVFRDLIVDSGLNDAAVTVVAFAPVAGGKQIRTLGDVGRRARDSFRHGVAGTRHLLPAPRMKSGNPSPAMDGQLAAAAVTTVDPIATLEESGEPVPGQSHRARRSEWRAKSIRVAERLVPTRQTTWEAPTEVRQFGVPGAHGVRIYRGRASEMGEESWRNRLPRVPVRQAWMWALVSLILVAAIAGGGWARERWFVTTVNFQTSLAAVDQSISDARKIPDPARADAEYLNAQRELGDARNDGAPESDITPRQQAITDGRDKLHNVIRLSDVTRIGGLPPELQGGNTRVVHTAAGKIFLVNGSLYQLQPDTKTIVKVLEEGSKIGNVTVGSLYGVADDTTGLYTTDGTHVFVFSSESQWQVVSLGEINDQGPWPAGSVGAFDGGLYILEAKYKNIYRFDADPDDGKSAAAVDWVQDSYREDLDDAVDLAMDGKIYLLMKDGHVVTFYKGAQETDIAPKYLQLQDKEQAVSIVNGPATNYLYVAVTSDSNPRVVAFDKTDKHEYQLELPAGFSTEGVDVKQPFDGLQAITVDENSGILYLINGDGVWSAWYSLPADALPP